MLITNIPDNWAERPPITVSRKNGRTTFHARASLSANSCNIRTTLESSGAPYTDEYTNQTRLRFAFGFAAESIIADIFEQEGFERVSDQTAYVIEHENIPNNVSIEGTADGLFRAKKNNLYGIPVGELVALEAKSTNPNSFAYLLKPNTQQNGDTINNYCLQASLHAIGCNANYAVIKVVNTDQSAVQTEINAPLYPDAVYHYAVKGIENVLSAIDVYKVYRTEGTEPSVNKNVFVRKGYCGGCRYRSLCHPNGIKMVGREDTGNPNVVVSELTEAEFFEKLRRTAQIKTVVAALNKVVNADTAVLRKFVESEDCSEISVPVSLTNDAGEILAGETTEYYTGVKTDLMRLVEATLDKYSAKTTGYAHISVKESPGKQFVPAANLPAVLANLPKLVAVGKSSTRTTVSRKTKPLTQKALDVKPQQ